MADVRLDLIERAARNNAAWCDAMCRAHGVTGRFDADSWVSPTRTPPRYPDAVTLAPAVGRDGLLERVDASAGCSVKDSFATLDLSTFPSWTVLFDATWMARPPGGVRPSPARRVRGDADWRPVTDADGLAAWAESWGTDDETSALWRPELLDQDVLVLAAWCDATVVAGAVVSVAAGVIGVSNVFGGGRAACGPALDPWPGCLAWIDQHLPGRPVVGYEAGDELTAAAAHGFEPIGPLRIWARTA